jgi:Lrp/AsnC family leucine-responsive transcriptional regulator
MEKLDKIDRKLINILQENSKCSLSSLAQQVFLTSPAVSSRLDRLEKLGVIKSYQANISLQKLGYHITAFVNLDMEPSQKPVFYPFIGSIPNVLECNCVTGQYSMLIKVAFPSTQELDLFIGKLQQFGRTYTQIVFSTAVGPRGIVVPEDATVTDEK